MPYLNEAGYLSFRVRDLASGAVRRLSTGVRDKAEAKKVLREMLQHGQGSGVQRRNPRYIDATHLRPFVPPEPWKVRYREFLATKTCKPSTIKEYEASEKLYEEFFGDAGLQAITWADIETLRKGLHDKGKAGRTIQGHVILLRGFFQWCVEHEFITKNPCRGIKQSRGEQREGVAFTVEEARKLLKACGEKLVEEVEGKRQGGRKAKWTQTRNPPPYLQLACHIGFLTSMRLSNVLGLRWSQVDLKDRKLTVQAGETKQKRRLVLPLHPELAEVLEARWKEGKPVKTPHGKTAFVPWTVDDHVLGEKVKWVLRAFKTACGKAGIEERVFKDLRTTTASWLADAGVPLQVAIHVTGHSLNSIGVHGRYAWAVRNRSTRVNHGPWGRVALCYLVRKSRDSKRILARFLRQNRKRHEASTV